MTKIKHAKTDSEASRTAQSSKNPRVSRVPIEPVIPDSPKAQTQGNAQVAAVGATSRRGRPFESGNKYGRGRPKGSLNKLSFSARQVIARDGPDLIVTMVEMGRQRNERILCALLPKILPDVKEPPPKIELEGKDDDTKELIVRFIPAPPRDEPPDGNAGS